MRQDLLHEIETFLRSQGIGEHRFGILAARNGRLVERLRNGGRIWPDTEERVRAFMAARRAPAESASDAISAPNSKEAV